MTIDLFGGTSADPTRTVPFAELVAVPFEGGPLPAVMLDDEPYVVLRPVVDALGLAWQSQHTKLKADESACVTLVVTQMPGDDQARQVVAVDLETFTLWLAGLQPGRVAEHAKAAVAIYRKRAGRALREHFFPAPGKSPATLSPRDLAQLVIAEADRADAAEARATAALTVVKELAPAAAAWDRWQATGATLDVGAAAKYLIRLGVDTGRNRLYDTLRDLGWVFRNSQEPMGTAVHTGYVEVEGGRTYVNPKTGEREQGGARTRLTTKGLERLAQHFDVNLDHQVLGQFIDLPTQRQIGA